MSAHSFEDALSTKPLPAVIVLGEILWDLFGDTRRLGGAPLNFAAHARALGHPVTLISALGDDEPGRQAAAQLVAFDIDTTLVQTGKELATGTASVRAGPQGDPVFSIARPAAYDAIDLSAPDLEGLARRQAGWFYFGTLLAAGARGRRILDLLLGTLGDATRLLDLNLRPGSDSPELALALLDSADVVKLNRDELERVREFARLPAGVRDFCLAGRDRFGWQAVCVTLGADGCAMLVGEEFVEAPGVPVVVADTVGAGDAFTAAFMHGLSRGWPAGRIATFANGIGASVAAQPGSLPATATAAAHDTWRED